MDGLRPVAGRVPVPVVCAALLSIHRERCIPATVQTLLPERQHAQGTQQLVSGLPSIRQVENTEQHLIASRLYNWKHGDRVWACRGLSHVVSLRLTLWSDHYSVCYC